MSIPFRNHINTDKVLLMFQLVGWVSLKQTETGSLYFIIIKLLKYRSKTNTNLKCSFKIVDLVHKNQQYYVETNITYVTTYSMNVRLNYFSDHVYCLAQKSVIFFIVHFTYILHIFYIYFLQLQFQICM